MPMDTDETLYSRNGTCWARTSKRTKGCIIGALIAVLIIVIVLAVCLSGSKTATKDEVCETQVCQEISKIYKSNINESVDPCDDFYSFACDNFKAIDGLHPTNAFMILGKQTNDLLIDQLAHTESELDPVKYISQFFQKATDKDLLDENNFTKVYEFVNEAIAKEEIAEQLMVATTTNGLPVFFELTFDTSASLRAVVRMPDFTLAKEDLIEETELANEYYRLISDSLHLSNSNTTFIQADIKAKEILDLERKLCDAGDEKEAIVVTTTNLKEQELYLKKIFKIVKRIVEDEISSQIKLEELEVSHPEYFKNLYRIFYGDDKYQLVSAEVATDLVTWKLIEKYGWTISSEFEKKQLKFKKRQNISENVSREMKILQQLFTLAPLPLVRLYFDAVSFNEIAAQKMADDLKSSFNETVKSNDWMNNETKADVQAKLAKTNISVGYPELIKNDTQLDDLFSIKLKESDDAFELILKMENLKFINSLKPNQVDWSPFDQPLGTFSSEGNIIMLPLLFNGVFYGPERPEFSNFGAIGSFIAAKITPTFDTSLVAKWWKKETWQQFKPKIENMTKKYEITDVTTKLELNSNYSQNSDLADNAGLRVAHEAYVSRKLKEPKLPDFASWSEEKMFFLSYANSMCEVASNEYLREQIKHGHTPARYRVNIPLSNLQTFADAFQCKSDSKMNPKEKVRVW